ncbi:secondary thiamine-phosphate synthase enzyme YjbQ [Patescibacteria group bacterium]|nr:secondary thiamine-phosphate synthase enzyme YjbQ [Patescibacteria group bacterium]
MKIKIKKIVLSTKSKIQFIDITKKIVQLVKKTDMGYVLVFAQHTTTALWVNENEKGLLTDIKKKIESFAPQNDFYNHKCDRNNASSHLQSLLFENPIYIPIVSGKLLLGTHQSCFFVELDGARKKREIIVQIISQ